MPYVIATGLGYASPKPQPKQLQFNDSPFKVRQFDSASEALVDAELLRHLEPKVLPIEVAKTTAYQTLYRDQFGNLKYAPAAPILMDESIAEVDSP